MKEYIQETLILVAEDGNRTNHFVPNDSDPKTIARAGLQIYIIGAVNKHYL